MHENSKSDVYAAAGVDITAGYRSVELIRKHKAEEAAQKAFKDGMNSFIFSKQKDFDYTIDND